MEQRDYEILSPKNIAKKNVRLQIEVYVWKKSLPVMQMVNVRLLRASLFSGCTKIGEKQSQMLKKNWVFKSLSD